MSRLGRHPSAMDPNLTSDFLAGAGLIGLAIGLAVYLAILVLMLWIGYVLVKAAVRNGLREHTLWLEARRGPLR